MRPTTGWISRPALALGAAAWGWLGRPAHPGPSWQDVSFPDGPTPTTIGVSLALSPDGSSLVLKDDILNGLLWIKRRAELSPVPIPGTERSNNPVFSPDGEWVAFIADARLKKIRPGGGAAITLADSVAGSFGGAAWLDDGTLIYVPATLSDLMRVSAAGGPSTLALRDPELAGAGSDRPIRSRGRAACCSRCAIPGA